MGTYYVNLAPFQVFRVQFDAQTQKFVAINCGGNVRFFCEWSKADTVDGVKEKISKKHPGGKFYNDLGDVPVFLGSTPEKTYVNIRRKDKAIVGAYIVAFTREVLLRNVPLGTGMNDTNIRAMFWEYKGRDAVPGFDLEV